MHAMIGIFKMDPAFFPQQKQALHDRIVPLVKGRPGFLRGTWSYDRASARSYSYIVLDSEESARQLAAFVKEGNQGPNPFGVQLESLTVVEVLAEAGEIRA
jgi:hypothetical protein